MKIYSKYLEDETFIKWVLGTAAEKDISHWNTYLKKHPKERNIIMSLRDVILTLRTQDKKLTVEEKQYILGTLLDKVDESHKPKVIGLWRKPLKYAAIFIVALGLGAFYYVSQIGQNEHKVFEGLVEVPLGEVSETQLVLSTGEQVVVNAQKSAIQYTRSGEVIINEKDTLNNDEVKKPKTELLNRLVVPYGKISNITLSDGTVVYVNAGSVLLFPEKFDLDKNGERIVYLTGEAFFEVASNKENPFVVKTREENLSIKAVGTKFNVSAYPTDRDIMTVLTEGEVHVSETKSVFNKSVTKMEPGQLASWNEEGEGVKLETVNTDDYTLWTLGLLRFESKLFMNVTKKLERYYNIEIDFDSSPSMQVYISGKLDLNDELEETLRNLAMATNNNVEFQKINEKKYRVIK
ncbi:FecR family protein [Maribacter sp. 2304DJ31-5]|uniref:FecR family protein n=1 Tax=Maribacter sp. 2304DJ31-5 TaxID=3386273 RepID=UPI0039BC6E9B